MNLAGKEDATVFKAFHTIQMRLQKDSNSIIYPYVKKKLDVTNSMNTVALEYIMYVVHISIYVFKKF